MERYEVRGKAPFRFAILDEVHCEEEKRYLADNRAAKLRRDYGRDVTCSRVIRNDGQPVYRIFIPLYWPRTEEPS